MGSEFIWWPPSDTWGEWYWLRMMISRRWSGIWQIRRWFGGGWRGSLAGRGRGRGCPDFSSKSSFSQCCSSVWRRGWLPPTWDGSYGVSRMRCCSYWWGGSRRDRQTGSGSTTFWRQGLRRWRRTFGEGRTWPRSTFLSDRFWTSVRQRRGIRGKGWGCGGGNRQELIWRGQVRQQRQRQRRTRMVWKSKGGG